MEDRGGEGLDEEYETQLIFSKLLYPSIRVRTAPPVSVMVRVRVRVSVSFSFTEID